MENKKLELMTQDLSAGYDGKTIVSDVNITIPQNKISVILGANGCGKSTLLKTFAKLLKPEQGSILLDGKSIFSMPSKQMAQTLGLLPQSPVVPEGIKVTDLVARGRFPYRKLLGGLQKEDFAAVEEALEMMGITELADACVDELSGGQRQRVAIARALALEPEILILDEATSALDVSVQQTIIELIVKLQKEKNITIGFICHDISLIQSCAHEVAVMYLGNVVEVLPAKNLSEHAVHPYTRALIGSIFDIGMDFGKPIEEIKGEAPSPLDVPAGCPFRGRCPKATEKCAAEKPKLHQIGADHEVACHLFDKEDK